MLTPTLPTALAAILIAGFLSGCAQSDALFGLDGGNAEETPVRRGPPPELDGLMHAKSDAVLLKMGTPTLLREEIDAQVWQYDHPACVLFFYLYREGEAFSVSHIEARSKEGGPVEPQTCVKRQFGASISS